jgi:hypothetical protein
MIAIQRMKTWTNRCLVLAVLLTMVACAEDFGRQTSTGTDQSSASTSPPGSTPSPKTGQTPADRSADATRAQAEDARFVATEEQGTKMWKATGSAGTVSGGNAPTVSIQNRGSKPLSLKVVNMLPAEHGFAIDSMKVVEVLQPGEERTVSVLLENIDSSVSEHRVYCQLHPKHVAATLIVVKDQPSATGRSTAQDTPADFGRQPQATTAPSAGGIPPGSQTGEVSSQITGESEGQRMIREQSQRQREIESTSRVEQAPSSIDSKACEDFPGFDRGCPGGQKP